jgi:hypothetical protein
MSCPKCNVAKGFFIEVTILSPELKDEVILRIRCMKCQYHFLIHARLFSIAYVEQLKLTKGRPDLSSWLNNNKTNGE